MSKIDLFSVSDFDVKVLKKKKGSRKIFVVFSTFGEREAELIYDKIRLLRSGLGDLIDKIFLSHRRKGAHPELTEQKARKADPSCEIIVCNDIAVSDMGPESGKGADMRRALYVINREHAEGAGTDDILIIFLDADVVKEHFGSHFVYALAGPLLEGYDFSKASFWRKMGRVKKFVAQPLFSVIRYPELEHLADLAYPLSGEVGGTLKFFNAVHFWQIYGIETGINIDASFGDFKTADVNLGLYDHEHHGEVNIQKMSFGIIRTYIKQLVDYGVITLNDGASVSDTFRASYIDEHEKRQEMSFDLTEVKYMPLREIL